MVIHLADCPHCGRVFCEVTPLPSFAEYPFLCRPCYDRWENNYAASAYHWFEPSTVTAPANPERLFEHVEVWWERDGN